MYGFVNLYFPSFSLGSVSIGNRRACLCRPQFAPPFLVQTAGVEGLGTEEEAGNQEHFIRLVY